MDNFILVLILLCLVGGIVAYFIRAKRKGQKCIGCPHCKTCQGNNCEGEKKP